MHVSCYRFSILPRRSCANLDLAKTGDVDNLPKMGEGTPAGRTGSSCYCAVSKNSYDFLSSVDFEKAYDSFMCPKIVRYLKSAAPTSLNRLTKCNFCDWVVSFHICAPCPSPPSKLEDPLSIESHNHVCLSGGYSIHLWRRRIWK